jgi:MFS transporter, DHA1 family, multidrug resistance protein
LVSKPRPAAGPSFPEFVALIALMMGLTAYSIDNVLPAFEITRQRFAVENPNDVPLLVYSFMIAFAISQAFYGPASDALGRRPLLLVGVTIFTAGSLLSLVAPSFEALLGARVIQGVGAGAARVLAVAIIRDRYEGRDMARVMSLAMMVFMMVPILAPATGSGLILVGGWHAIFISMLALGLLLGLWFGMRMPETLPPGERLAFSASGFAGALRLTVTTRVCLGYTIAIGLMRGSLLAYIGSAQQILETTVYGLGAIFTLYFAVIALAQAGASLLNARMVMGIGMRRLSHGGVCGFLAVSALLLIAALLHAGKPPLGLFMGLLMLCFFLFSFTIANFNAMAMQPLGAVAGTASSFIGAVTTFFAALCGLAVARAFDGTVVPLAAGFCLLGAGALGAAAWAERGRLFGSGKDG